MRLKNAEDQKQRAADRLQPRRQAVDPALVEAVGDIAGRQGQQKHRQELAQSHQTQRQGRALHVIDLPADRDRLDLDRQGGDEPRTDEEIEIAVAIRCFHRSGLIMLRYGRKYGVLPAAIITPPAFAGPRASYSRLPPPARAGEADLRTYK